MADTHGSKRTLLFAMIAVFISYVLFATATSITQVLVARAIAGMLSFLHNSLWFKTKKMLLVITFAFRKISIFILQYLKCLGIILVFAKIIPPIPVDPSFKTCLYPRTVDLLDTLITNLTPKFTRITYIQTSQLLHSPLARTT